MLGGIALTGAALAATVSGRALVLRQSNGTTCPGYSASNVQTTNTGLTADLSLAGPACNSYGSDISALKLSVNYDTAKRLHVKLQDSPAIAYTVPESVFPYPSSNASVSADEAELEFSYEQSPFSFRVVRKVNNEVLFDSSAESLIFQDQYLRLRTALPGHVSLYGLGEHSDNFRLNSTNYTRTLWSRDSYGIPEGTNLYGNHPVYFDHRGSNGTHGVYLHSSSGMDVKIDKTASGQQYLEYNLMSGILDLFFMAGSTPTEVSKQYAEIAGLPAEMPYWGFGLHQCRYGYRDFYGVAEVVANYSAAKIPLETMWTDIDYMYERFIMTTNPDRFPIPRVRDIVDYLHEHDQHYIVMVDPAVAHQEKKYDDLEYTSFTTPRDNGYFVYKNGSIYKGVVWPGVTAFPDWFHPEVQQWWNDEFVSFFDVDTGVDIDGLWIDMNEAANFNLYGDNPEETQEERSFPPARPALRSQPRPIPGFPAAFQPGAQDYPPDDYAYAPPWLAADSNPNEGSSKKKRSTTGQVNAAQPAKRQALSSPSGAELIGYPDRNFLAPPYQINNENTFDPIGGLSNFTLDTDIVHYDGHVELDVHNLYGSMMSEASRTAMLARRSERRPLVITRSTFAGAGRSVGKWLGDNLSTWAQYRNSIQGMLNFASLFQVPMVGSDICGFGANTTETLCARWVSLGAFYTFMRNHNGDTSIPQEFYLWDTVAEAARNALDIRYRLLDYIYTGFHKQSVDGTPVLNPLWFLYPEDTNTFGTQLQFFYGDSLLISPVTEENSTSVTIYLPNDRFYNWGTWEVVEGEGKEVNLTDIAFTEIPIHVKGGSILPVRNKAGYTTTETRKSPFEIIVAPGRDGKASGSLYLDDGDSLVQAATSEITFEYANGELVVGGTFGYTTDAHIASVIVLGGGSGGSAPPSYKKGHGEEKTCEGQQWSRDSVKGVTTAYVDEPLDGELVVRI
ncbi:Putative glycoside hydrolase family 31, galactose mutarotase-like domain superfamily [Septoria linicola]|uniref:Probable alpha/beta-glucosidase agdC n=1 Tax=Septoria linicola TaxID=215465 RepID=A0A9Q9ELD1_9PEZI|nr:Putative glycoside hydrolase family 31, galactose mutarotase-like domain superfamily [Septoria linicola]